MPDGAGREERAAPATWGAAMLVPRTVDQPPGTEDSTSTPGAATSGLSRSEIVVGPTDENSACDALAGLPLISTAPTRSRVRELAGDETEPAPTSL